MNAEQLKKNVGQLLRLRPQPVVSKGFRLNVGVLTSGGRRLEAHVVKTDYDWLLENVSNQGVTLHCLYTGHTITLGADNVREYRSPNFLILKCQLTLDGNAVRVEPLL